MGIAGLGRNDGEGSKVICGMCHCYTLISDFSITHEGAYTQCSRPEGRSFAGLEALKESLGLGTCYLVCKDLSQS